MCFVEMFGDREAQPRAALLARSARVDAVEPLENAGQVVGRYSRPGVRDPDEYVVAGTLRRHLDAATGLCMPEGVVEEIGEDLPQRLRIGVDGGRIRGRIDGHAPIRRTFGERSPRLTRRCCNSHGVWLGLPSA